MKKLNTFAAASLLFLALTGCNNQEEAKKLETKPAAAQAPVYEDEYTFELYKVREVYESGRYADATNGSTGGLYFTAEDLQDVEAGDVVRAVFDAADGEFVAVEMWEEK